MNPQKRAGAFGAHIHHNCSFSSAVRCVLCPKTVANFEIDGLVVFGSVACRFTAVLIAAVPQIIKVFSGDDAQLAPSGIEKANRKTLPKTFVPCCLSAAPPKI